MDLELLVAKIQRDLAPNAEVIHDVRITGRYSETVRQIDVVVQQKVGQYEIKIIIDCKDYEQRVDVKGVEEFYGLVQDVGAQKGVLVCPNGFTAAAKKRAQKLQMDLYSPLDTEPNRWAARVTIPTFFLHRSASMAFGIDVLGRHGFAGKLDKFPLWPVFAANQDVLGSAASTAEYKWNKGLLPFTIGEHLNVPLFDNVEVRVFDGLGGFVPVNIYVNMIVTQDIYYGQCPITKITGFIDEITNRAIANSMTVGLLEHEDVAKTWLKLDREEDAPLMPVFSLVSLRQWQ